MKQLILFTFLLLAIVSCRQQIDEHTTILPEDVFETSEQAIAAVDTLYTTGTPTFYGQATTKSGPVAAIGGYLSGYFDNESKNEVKLAEFCQQLTFDNNNIASTIDNIWNSAYSSIGQSNVIIKKLTVSTKIDDKNKRELIAEAKFFRAFNYFFLVRYFGEIPLVDEGQRWQESNKSSIADVYSFIINDLNAAIEHLSTQNARISSLIAKTLLLDVYLTASGYPLQAHYYEQSAILARDIIQNGSYTLVANDSIGGVSAYKTLYNQSSSELIYSYLPSENTFFALSFSKSASSWGVFSTEMNNAYKPMKEFLNVYDTELDIRAGEGEFFHSFYKYEKGDRTVIQSFEHSPCIWFDNKSAGSDSMASPKSISIYRFAEVLLIAAEAIAQNEGVTSEAVGYVAKIRSRAYPKVDESEIISQLAALSKEQFIEEVWKERLREFPLEMKLWNDIQRTRKYPIPLQGGNITFVDIAGAMNPWGAVYGLKSLLLSVPENIASQDKTTNNPQ